MPTATIIQSNEGQNTAADANVALPLRADTFLGVCEAIGQDLGINPNWLRIAFAPFIMLNPVMTIAVYLGLGAVVAISRWAFPAPKQAQPAVAESAVEEYHEVEERLAA